MSVASALNHVAIGASMLFASLVHAAEPLDEIRALIAQSAHQPAYAQLRALDASVFDPVELNFLLALTALNTGKHEEALRYLDTGLGLDPDDPALQVLRGRALFESGDLDGAEAAFSGIANGAVPAAAQKTIQTYLKQIAIKRRPREATTRWQAVVGLGGGYDTNANRATDDATVSVPVFNNLPFVLLDSAQQIGSPVVTLDAAGEFHGRLSRRWQLLLGAAVRRLEFTDDDARRFDQDTYQLSGGFSYAFGRQQIRAQVSSNWFTVDNDLFRRTASGSLDWRMLWDRRTSFNAFFSAGDVQYHPRSVQSVRDVTRWIGGAGVSHVVGPKQNVVLRFGLHGGVEDDHATGARHLGRTLYGLQLGPQWIVSRQLRVHATALIETSDYGSAEPLFLRRRDDTYYTIRGGLEYRFSGAWALEPSIQYVRNRSNIPTSDYDSLSGLMSIRYYFD